MILGSRIQQESDKFKQAVDSGDIKVLPKNAPYSDEYREEVQKSNREAVGKISTVSPDPAQAYLDSQAQNAGQQNKTSIIPTMPIQPIKPISILDDMNKNRRKLPGISTYSETAATHPYVKFKVDNDPKNKISNVKFAVRDVTQDNIDRFVSAQQNGTLEYWFVNDGSDVNKVTAWNNVEIGRDRLAGIKDTDTVIFYDTATQELYRLDKATEGYEKASRLKDIYEGMATKKNEEVSTALGNLQKELSADEARMKDIADLIEAGSGTQELYDEFNALNDKRETYYPATQKQLIDDYDKTMAHYTEVIKQYSSDMEAEGLGEVMSTDQAKAFDEMAAQYADMRKQFNGMKEYIADSEDPNQVNSLMDVIRNQVKGGKDNLDSLGNLVKAYLMGAEDLDEKQLDFVTKVTHNGIKLKEDMGEMLLKYTVPLDLYKGIADGTITKETFGVDTDAGLYAKAGLITVLNWLNNAAETSDITNNFLKPFLMGTVVASNSDGQYHEKLPGVLNEINIENPNAEPIENFKYGIRAVADAWGLNGSTPTYDWTDVMSPDKDTKFFSKAGLSGLAMEILLDPGTYAGAVVDGRVVKSIGASNLDDIIYDVASKSGVKLEAGQMSDIMRQIGKRTAKRDESLEDAFSAVVQNHLLKADPEIALIYKDSAKKSAAELQQSLLNTKFSTIVKDVADAKGSLYSTVDNYDVIMKTVGFSQTYKNIDKFVSMASVPGAVVPLKLLGKTPALIGSTLGALGKLKDSTLVGTALDRLNGALKKHIDAKGIVNPAQARETFDTISKEFTSAAALADSPIIFKLMENDLHKGVINTMLRNELDNVTEVLKDSNLTPDKMLKVFDDYAKAKTAKTSLETNSFVEYIKGIKNNEVLGKALDVESTAQLDYLISRYNRIKTGIQYDNVTKVLNALHVSKLKLQSYLAPILDTNNVSFIEQLNREDGVIERHFMVRGEKLADGDILKAMYEEIIDKLNRYDISIIDGFTDIDKTAITNRIAKIKSNVTDIIDTLYSKFDATTDINLGDEVKQAMNDTIEEFVELEKDTEPYRAALLEFQYAAATNSYNVISMGMLHAEIPDESVKIETTIDDVIDKITDKLNKMHSMEVDTLQVGELIHRTVDEVMSGGTGIFSPEELSRVYTGTLSKLSMTKLILEDEVVDDLCKYINSSDSSVAYVADNIRYMLGKVDRDIDANSLEYSLRDLQRATASIETTRELFDNIDITFLRSHRSIKHGILDGVATNAQYINKVVRGMTDITPEKVAYTARLLASKVAESAANYLSNKDTSFYKFWERKGVHYNTMDTAENVKNILNNLSDLPYEADERFYDVFVSASSASKNSSPFMVSFAHEFEDGVQSFRNADHTFHMIPEQAKRMYNSTVEEAEKAFHALSEQGVDKYEYITQVRDYIYFMQDKARALNKQIRFIGFNNSDFGTGQTQALKQFFKDANAKVVTTEETFVDLADILRNQEKVFTITDTEVNALSGVIQDSIYKTRSNMIKLNTLCDTVYDTNTNLLNITNAVSDGITRLGQQLVDKGGTTESYLSLEHVSSLMKTLSRASQLHYKLIGKYNELGNIVINEKELIDLIRANGGKYSSRLNIQKLISDAMQLPGNVTYNARKLYDTEIMGSWYDLKRLKEMYAPGMYEVCTESYIYAAHQLSNIYDTVNAPELLDAISSQNYDYLLEAIKKQLAINKGDTIIGTGYDALLNASAQTDDVIKKYAMAYYLYNKVKDAPLVDKFICRELDEVAFKDAKLREDIIPEADVINVSLSKHPKYDNLIPTNPKVFDAYYTLEQETADALVFNTSHSMKYNAVRKVVETTYADVLNPLNKFRNDLMTLQAATRHVADLNSYLNLNDIVYNNNYAGSGVDYIKATLFNDVYGTYKRMVDRMNNVARTFPGKLSGSPLDVADSERKYVGNISMHKHAVTELSDAHNKAIAHTVLSLSPKKFATFVVRDCKNMLVINANSAMMKSEVMQKLLATRLNDITNAGDLTYKVENGKIYIYKDFSIMGSDELHKYMETIQKQPTNYKKLYRTVLNSKISERMKELAARLKEIPTEETGLRKQLEMQMEILQDYADDYVMYTGAVAKYVPDQYFVSQFSANTQDAIEAIYMNAPKESLYNNSVEDMKALYQDYGLFDSSFNCNVIGDTADKMDIYPQYSENILSNIGMGMNHVKNNLEATTNYFRLYDNPSQRLEQMLKNSYGKASVEAINKALKDNGYVVHKGTVENGKWILKKYTLRTDADVLDAIKDGAICTPMDVYTHMLAFSKGETIKFRINEMNGLIAGLEQALGAANAEVRALRFTGWLFTSVGSAARNLVDATMKAAIMTQNLPGFMMSTIQFLDEHSRYKDLVAQIGREQNRLITPAEIIKYYKTHADAPLPIELAMYYYKQGSLAISGMADEYDVIKTTNIKKIENNLSPELIKMIGKKRLDEVEKLFARMHKKTKHMNVEKALIYSDADIKAYLKQRGISDEYIDEVKRVYKLYQPTEMMLASRIKAMPIAGNLFEVNARLFSGVETMIRGGMFKYYIDEYGYSANRAADFVRESQFDYGNRPAWLDRLEFIMPFSTYKLYNTKFWGTHFFDSARTITKILGEGGLEFGYDTQDIELMVHNAYIREQIASGAFVPEEQEYQGTSELNAEDKGFYQTVGGYYVNGGFSLIDVVKIISGILGAPGQLASGKVPDIIKDNLYSPYVNAVNLFRYWADNRKHMSSLEIFSKYTEANQYNMIDFIPAFGAIINRVMTTISRGGFNLSDFNVMQAVPELGEVTVQGIAKDIADLFSTYEPSLFGKIKSPYLDKEVGYNWYDQDEVYKDMHRYIQGRSATLTHNPITYVNYKSFYMSLGYTEKEATQLMNFIYNDKDSASKEYKYGVDKFNHTLEALTNQGYSVADVLRFVMEDALWVDGKNIRTDGIAQNALESSGFFQYFKTLPDYVKYNEGQYKKLLNHYMEQGYNMPVAQYLIKNGNGFVDSNGHYATLTPEQMLNRAAEADNSEQRDAFYKALPDWYKYEDGAVERAMAVLANRGMSDEEAYAFILKNNFYVTTSGKPTYKTDKEVDELSALNKKDFLDFWNRLPEYTRYTKGAGSRTMKLLFSLGYDQETVRGMMLNGAYYDGNNLIDCRGLKSEYASKWVNYNNYHYWSHGGHGYASNWYGRKYSVDGKSYAYLPYGTKQLMNNFTAKADKKLPKQFHARAPYVTKGSFSSTYSKQNVYYGSTFGARKIYKVKLGFSQIKETLSSKAQYPTAYRNIVFGYRRSLYKEQYAKYGASRMMMRSGGWKGYSNASVVRLRRENIRNAMKYNTRRNNL